MFQWFTKRLEKWREPQAVKVRRWDAARTDRLNAKHWGRVTEQTINEDLKASLKTLRTRCEHEASTNPFVEGVITTHVIDVVGQAGPTLQVQSEDKKYNEDLERHARRFLAMPDVNGMYSMAEFLQMWVRLLWTCGEFLAQKVTAADVDGPYKLRLQNLHPRRLYTPYGSYGDSNVILGVHRDKAGKPLGYFIDQAPEDSMLGVGVNNAEISAEDIIHRFRVTEPGQARGIPFLASSLQNIADLRDFDEQVLDAARAAADSGVFLFTNHSEAKYIEVNESVDIERRMVSTLPPGWEPKQMIAQQPPVGYVEYRAERLRELGRPVGMPLMMVKLDSSNHNYSSARFDGQTYQRGNRCLQTWIDRTTLTPLIDEVAVEARLGGELSAPPDRVRYQWTWPVPPHVDPLKEGKATTEGRNNRTLTFAKACAANGDDWEMVIEQLEREDERFKKAGISIDAPVATGPTSGGLRDLIEEVVEEMLDVPVGVGGNGRRL